MLSFDIFRQAVLHAKRLAGKEQVNLFISLVTNGSMLNDEHIAFMLSEDIDLVVSFDILPDVHNRQRSHYEVVANTLHRLIAAHLYPGIRATITPLNAGRQVEMVEELHRSFPELGFVAFEAVLNNGIFKTQVELRTFYDTFVEQYFLAVERGEALGIQVGNTIHNSIQERQERACPGKLVLTSDASLTACSRISAKGDPHYDLFRFGFADAEGVHVDQEKYDRLMGMSRIWVDREGETDHPECKQCIAKWHCGGGCLLARESSTEAQMEEFCRFTRQMVDRSYAYRLKKERKVYEPEDYPLLTVLPNNVCNFSCPYCYSIQGRNGAHLDPSRLLSMVKWFVAVKPDHFSQPLTISYMGGGEPMLSWGEIKEAIVYAEQATLQRGFELTQRIITNGSILDDEQIGFLHVHKIHVSVSFEILEDVQNRQRRHYSEVERNIHKLLAKGIPVEINATITPINAGRQVEMITLLHERYPEVHGAMFEPVTGMSLFDSPDTMDAFYDTYLDQFLKSREMARKWGISLTSFPFLRTVFPLDRACAGELCITADGNLTGCYCISSPKEKLFPRTVYGKVTDEGEVQIDREQYHRLMDVNVYAKPQCAGCTAKWHCGGGCFYQMESYTQPYRDAVCRFTRRFVEKLVLQSP